MSSVNLIDALIAAVGALSGAVVFMFLTGLGLYRELRADHKACEASKQAMFERVIRLEERTGTERRTPS